MTTHYVAAIKAGIPLDYDASAVSEYISKPAVEMYFVASFWGVGGTIFPPEILDDEFPALRRMSLHFASDYGDPLADSASYWGRRAVMGGFVLLMTPTPAPYQRYVLASLAGLGINILKRYPGADEVTPYLQGAAAAGLVENNGRYDRPWNPSRAIGRELPDPLESVFDRQHRERAEAAARAAGMQSEKGLLRTVAEAIGLGRR